MGLKADHLPPASVEDKKLWVYTSTAACVFKACYRDSLTSVYVSDVRTSQQTHIWASTSCYRDTFTFYF
jgi:hypothetical protein